MTTFDDRQKGFENKFAHDKENEFKVAVLRNKMLGRWVAELLGKEGESVDNYANAIVMKSIEGNRTDAIIEVALHDLEKVGSSLTEKDIRVKMEELAHTARTDLGL